jgi:transcriptional regulator with XRE-family HTH domain
VPEVDEAIGFNVHALLYRRKASQKQLALALGITPSVLSKKLRGDSAWSARQVSVAANYLDVEPGRLFTQSTVCKLARDLAVVQGSGRRTVTTSPMLHALPGRG